LSPATGNVTVNGKDVTVPLNNFVASCGSSSVAATNSTINTIKDNFQNSSYTLQIWSNNTSVPDPMSNFTILTNDSVSCQIVQFEVNPASYVFIRPGVVVNNNGSFFGLTFTNGTSVPYLANETQNFYYTNGPISGTVDITFTLPGHGGCD
jgi:hypothetical protein